MQAEEATAEKCKLEQELLFEKQENESSASADTMMVDLSDKYEALLCENSVLKRQLEAKCLTERLN